MNHRKSCCNPAAGAMADGVVGARDRKYLDAAMCVRQAGEQAASALRDALTPISGGIFEMGTRKSTFPEDLDSPRRKVRLSPYLMSPTAVTNAEFACFVDATGYRTVAEQEGWSYVFHGLLGDASADWPVSPPGLPWWRKVDGACWKMPQGPGSDIACRSDHPVVHIAWYDALAYTQWSGLRLPTEAEWERAARAGLKRKKFPWGNEMMPGGEFAMNIFQGSFPHMDTGREGWGGPAPVTAYEPNAFGMWNMTGNVWEWVQDRYGVRPSPGKLPEIDPKGPSAGHARIQRGGSYLCHASYCDRYHVHSRTRNDPDSSTGNSGFRVAGDP